MLFPLKSSVVLKFEGKDIVLELLLIPMWHLFVAYLSTGLALIESCVGATDALCYPILLMDGAKWNLLHQVLVGWPAL